MFWNSFVASPNTPPTSLFFSTTFSFLHPFRLLIPSPWHRCPWVFTDSWISPAFCKERKLKTVLDKIHKRSRRWWEGSQKSFELLALDSSTHSKLKVFATSTSPLNFNLSIIASVLPKPAPVRRHVTSLHNRFIDIDYRDGMIRCQITQNTRDLYRRGEMMKRLHYERNQWCRLISFPDGETWRAWIGVNTLMNLAATLEFSTAKVPPVYN